MLDSRKKVYADTKVVTIIGAGTTVSGDLKSKGAIRIEGAVLGKVYSDTTVDVQESGQVKAEIVAAQVIISGEVTGNVFAHERIEITPKGRLFGDITSPRVAISEGVLFEGKCVVKAPPMAGAAGASVASDSAKA